ncbi:MBL fold metallo-hydrolase [Guyparkeria sp. 1SP6A2]|nr:MBL fold metallo-hydrolase [Guyparkeria sp. 1SP6A2]
MRLSFHGANRDVTGSCHLLEADGRRILIDCGMFQGGPEEDEKNAEHFGFDPRSIDILLLTHAHLDHCGRIPLLSKRGFDGEIIATTATRDLANLVMMDSAHIQEEDAEHSDAPAYAPLYEVAHVREAMDLFGRHPEYEQPIKLSDDLTATFFDAGHILGAASIRIECREDDTDKAIVFSGDIGSSGSPLLRDPHVPPQAETVLMETTYGDRIHQPIEVAVQELFDAINATIDRGGNVIVPTFALERAQELLYHLREGVEQGKLPHDLPVYLDSPMAITATEIFRNHREYFNDEARAILERGDDPFSLPRVEFTREQADSMKLNDLDGAVIMAGSGMCTGGRVGHHLLHNLRQPESTVIFVGFAAPGTLARWIMDGAESVDIFGDEIPVKAHVHTINGFSAHADRDELLAWHEQIKPERTILVHGEEQAMQAFAKVLQGTEVRIPEQGEAIDL